MRIGKIRVNCIVVKQNFVSSSSFLLTIVVRILNLNRWKHGISSCITLTKTPYCFYDLCFLNDMLSVSCLHFTIYTNFFLNLYIFHITKPIDVCDVIQYTYHKVCFFYKKNQMCYESDYDRLDVCGYVVFRCYTSRSRKFCL